MKKSILFISVFVILFISLNAQQVYKTGGTSNSTFLLGNTSARKSQCMYWPSDLTNAASGSITRIYYKYGSTGITSNQVLTNFTIQMLQTSATSFVGDSVFMTGFTPVFISPSYTIPAGTMGNWFPIDLSTPFVYNVSQTIVIQLTFDACSHNSWGTFGTNNTPLKKLISSNVNATAGDQFPSTTWQDFGFDLAPVGVMPVSSNPLAVEVFPNPCQDRLMILIPGEIRSGSMEISMLNILGEEVLKKEILMNREVPIDVSGLPRGVYFLKVKFEDAELVRRVILE